jgi:hypothetical protein
MRKSSSKRLRDSLNPVTKKEKFAKGIRDSRDSKRERNVSRKGSFIAKGSEKA